MTRLSRDPLSTRPSSLAVIDQERRLSHALRDHQPPHFPDTLVAAPSRVPDGFTPSKPQLTTLPEMRMIRSMERLYTAGERKLSVHADEFDAHKEELDKLLVQNAETLKEKAQRTQTATMWDTLRNIGAGILAAVSTFLGLSLLSAGGSTLIGGALIASGIMSIANLALTDAGLWEWLAEKLAGDNEEKQQKIAALIPCVLGLMAAGLGMAGLGAFALWGTLPAAPRALTVVQAAVNLATIVTTVSGEISQARVSWSQASLVDLQGKLSLHYHKVERLSEQMEEVLEQETQTHRLAKSLLNLTNQTKQALLA